MTLRKEGDGGGGGREGGLREWNHTEKTVVLKRVVIVMVNVVTMTREGKSGLKEKERE